jgi:hypothetical protein
MKAPSRQALSTLVLLALLGAGSASLHAQGNAPRSLTHCVWGDLGCNNPPPLGRTGSASVVPKPVLATPGGGARKACDPVLSSPGECWTNCKTEDDITICDIVKSAARPND